MNKTQARAVFDKAQDPFWFFTHVLGWTPTAAARAAGYTEGVTPDQRRVVESVQAHRATAVPAGVGVGKTRIAAGLAIQFLFTHPHSKVITTAPNGHQVEHLLWREIRTCYAQARVPLGGRILTTQLDLAPDWFAIGLSPSVGQEDATATRAAGFHAPYVLVIGDEATGIHPAVIEALEGAAVGGGDRMLLIGNPTDPTSRFKALCESPAWHTVTLSGLSHPNVLHDDPAIIPGAVTKAWIDAKRLEYGGVDSPLFRAKVLGLWPEQGDDMLISLAWVEAAQAQWQPPTGPVVAAGCDVARYGSDATVLARLYGGGLIGPFEEHRGWNTMATAGALLALGVPLLAVDDTGLGGGVTDRLQEQRVAVQPENFGAAAHDPTRFANRRAELYWGLREALRTGDWALPPDGQLAADLTNCKYGYDSKGRILLEPKDAIRRRMGRSPDRGDALALLWGARFSRPLPAAPAARQYNYLEAEEAA